MKHIEVVAAIIIHDGKILCVQRGPAKYDYISHKWEFPGGKVEESETKLAAIVREIREELHMDISVDAFFTTVNHTYPDFQLTMHSYLCSCPTNELTLTEHNDFKWLSKDELKDLDWAAADEEILLKVNNQEQTIQVLQFTPQKKPQDFSRGFSTLCFNRLLSCFLLFFWSWK